jgi:hypothetical protein
MNQTTATPDLAAEMRQFHAEMMAELQAIRGLLEQRSRPGLSRIDRARLARMLPAIAGVYGSDLFVTRELFERDAPAIRLVLAGLNPKQVGRLFARADGQPIDGYLIESQGSETNVRLWRVMQVDGFPAVRNLTVPPRAPRAVA